MSIIKLQYQTPQSWVDAVLSDFDRFLQDHAAAEKKASGMAVSMLSHYPDRIELVKEMADLAVEEMVHFKEVIKLIHQRGGILGRDEKDIYVTEFRKAFRKGTAEYFLDRLLVGGVIEARGAERFGLIAEALPEGGEKKFYQAITRSEERHNDLFVDLAFLYFEKEQVIERLEELLVFEAKIISEQPIRATLH